MKFYMPVEVTVCEVVEKYGDIENKETLSCLTEEGKDLINKIWYEDNNTIEDVRAWFNDSIIWNLLLVYFDDHVFIEYLDEDEDERDDRYERECDKWGYTVLNDGWG